MKLHLSCSALLLPLLAQGQEAAAPHDPITTAWQAFQAAHGPQWTADWNKATGTPKAIYGGALEVKEGRIANLAEARRLAELVLANHAALLGTGGSRFVEEIGAHVAQVNVFVYDQYYQGLPVLGGRADVRIHDTGRVAMFGSKAVQIPDGFVLVPAITAAHARTLALAHLDLDAGAPGVTAPGTAPGERLVIWADVEGAAAATPVLAWEVQVDVRKSATDLTVGKVYVDARRGGIVEWRDEVYTCWAGHRHVRGETADHEGPKARLAAAAARRAELEAERENPPVDIVGNVTAWTNLGLSPLNARTNVPLQGLRVTASGAGSAFTDANGDFRIPFAGTNPVTLTVNFGSGSGQHLAGGIQALQGSPVSVSLQATPGVPAQVQLLTQAATENEWSQSTVFYWTDAVNRYCRGIIGNSPQMNTISNVRATVNRASTCNAFYTGNSINFYARGGSCNMTAYSTVVAHEWGHGLDDAYGGISQTDGMSEGWGDTVAIYLVEDPIVGRDFTTSGGIVRSALNTLRYPAGGGVHQQGQTWMGFNWDVRTNLMNSLGNQAGDARAEQIVLASIVADATNQPDAVREVFVLDDDDGILGNGTPNYAALEAAAVKRNLPYPRLQLGTIAHTPLPSTEDQLEPQLVRADVVAVSGSFTKVEVVYDAGSGTQRREMVRSGNGNEMLALLPGVLSPQAVSYHIEAQHSTGPVIRFPTAGELGYAVGNEQVFFSTDFENGTAGWTHGLVRTQDDWQLGTPAGRSGSSGGVSWSDPATAASGQSCWGNDLGGSGFNGAYQPNVESWLRSPVMNLSGRSGVTLRFKRWLTVEEGQYDQATILVNGQQVWVNPTLGHTVDTAWTDFALPIPAADNNPAVTLEWRLRTDGGLNLGGWNIDDVALFSFQQIPPPAVQYTLTPPQIPLGQSSTIDIQGTPLAAAAILISDSQGPTQIPGLPVLHIGSNFFAVPVLLDNTGSLTASFPAPVDPAATGALFFSQVVEVFNGQVETSNKMVILFGK